MKIDLHIPHNKPCIDSQELRALKKVMNSSWLIAGAETEKLEKTFSTLTQKQYAVAVNSGLSALHLSLLALNIKQGDEVILPTFTCAALLHAVNYVGAKPVLVDSSKVSINMDPEEVKQKISKKTKAIIAPHTFGFPVSIIQLKSLGVPVIEDCAQAIGTTYNEKYVGYFGDLSVFSFYASKMIAAGQGGMVLTSNKNYYKKIWDLVNHDQRKAYKVRYNYRLTDLAACVANAQMNKLSLFLKKRKAIARRYKKVLRNNEDVKFLPKVNDTDSNHYRFLLQFTNARKRKIAQEHFKNNDISTIIPIERYQLLHNQLKLSKYNFPHAERLSQTLLSLPNYPCLADGEIERVLRVLQQLTEN